MVDQTNNINGFIKRNYTDELISKASKIEILAFDVDGVLTDGGIYVDHDGKESKRFYAQDGHGIKIIQSINLKTVIISGRSSISVEHRGNELGVDHIIQGTRDKLSAFSEKFMECKNEALCYIGDDTVDIELLNFSGLSVIVPNSNKLLFEIGYDWVTPRSGGYGALRDVCDLIYYSKTIKNEKS